MRIDDSADAPFVPHCAYPLVPRALSLDKPRFSYFFISATPLQLPLRSAQGLPHLYLDHLNTIREELTMDYGSIINAAQERNKENQKDLPQALADLFTALQGEHLAEDNGRLKLVPVPDLSGTPIPTSLGLFVALREMSEEDFTALAVALLKGDAKLNMNSYASSDNHYITFNGPSEDEEETTQTSSTTRRRGRRNSNRA